jgi:hypothetical protein
MLLAPVIALALGTQVACAQQKAAERQIAEAVAALPSEMREGAAVLGYQRDPNKLVELRNGTNGMICLADHPGDDDFHVACYHESLAAFMARGRELRTEGKNQEEVRRIRGQEIEAGTLQMPDHPAALYSLTGGTLNLQMGEVEGARGLYVVYIPYATEESTGIPATPSRERPWLMFPGTPWAHIMISR